MIDALGVRGLCGNDALSGNRYCSEEIDNFLNQPSYTAVVDELPRN